MRNKRFTFLCTTEDRLSLEQLAAFHQRSKGDTIRFLIYKELQAISEDDPHKTPMIGGKSNQKVSHA